MKSDRVIPKQGEVIRESGPDKIYGGTALKAARHFHHVGEGTAILAVADEMVRNPAIEVVAVVDEALSPRGLILRDRLFALLGKPFGREVLGRLKAGEICERAPVLDSHAGLYAVAAAVLDGPAHPEDAKDPGARERGTATQDPYRILVDGEGRFAGILSSRDLADFLSRMTQDDIDLAGRIQERLEECNEEARDPRLSFEAWSRAAKGVGGDFWFTKRLPGQKLLVALCDVSGKGVAASLVVSMVWGMMLMYDYGRGLRELLLRLNEYLVLTFRLERYLTGMFAVIDPGTGVMELADMGHSHASVVRDGRFMRLRSRAGNLPLGIEAGTEARVERLALRPGDLFFCHSDGCVEQEDGSGEEFGEERLAGLLVETRGGHPSLKDTLPAALDSYRGRVPQQDDMTFFALRWLGGSRSPAP